MSATFTTLSSSTPSTESFPVVKEGRSWKVCFSTAIDSVQRPSPTNGIPTTDTATTTAPGSENSSPASGVSTLPSSLPGAAGVCSGSTSGFGVASDYVGAAEIGVPQVAQACVYQNQVPEAVTTGLAGKLYVPTTTDQNAMVIDFEANDRTRKLTVTTAKEPDGHYYVVAVRG